MNRYYLLPVFVPLIIANLVLNLVFWSSHTNSVAGKMLACLWALGLTAVEFIFPAWGIKQLKSRNYHGVAFLAVGLLTSVLSVGVFASALSNAINGSYQSLTTSLKIKEHQEWEYKIQNKLAEEAVHAAGAANHALERLNQVDKISKGTLPALTEFNKVTSLATDALEKAKSNTTKVIDINNNSLAFLITVSSATGLSIALCKTLLEIFLATIVQIAAVLSFLSYVNDAKRKDKNTVLPNDMYSIVKANLLKGLHGDVPVLADLPEFYKGSGLRYSDVQTIRDELLKSGELTPVGKRRVKLTNAIGNSNE